VFLTDRALHIAFDIDIQQVGGLASAGVFHGRKDEGNVLSHPRLL